MEISAALWALWLGKVFTLFHLCKMLMFRSGAAMHRSL